MSNTVLIHDLSGGKRWDFYLSALKETLNSGRSSILLLPDVPLVLKAKDKILEELKIKPYLSYRKQTEELKEWVSIGSSEPKVVLGTRSAVFAPVTNLGLIIIEAEEDNVYKQDQVPHYHAREVALKRAEIEGAKVILGSNTPSLESYYLAKNKRIEYNLISRGKPFPEIKIIDTRRLPFVGKNKRPVLARLLEESIYSVLQNKGKILLFLNRRGFATQAACHNCQAALKCPRCNVNLIYHFKTDILSCHYCNFKMPLPNICPSCNAGYIKFSGAGTERIESELSRIFPQARIKILDDESNLDIVDSDIIISTSACLKHPDLEFDLVGVLGIDNTINRIDFRSSEKAFCLLSGLINLTSKQIIIQTASPELSCFQALLKKDANIFYDNELKVRKQLGFPPYKHMILIKLRGKFEDKVKDSALSLFKELSKANINKDISIVSVNPAPHIKLRGNFYWQILIVTNKVLSANVFLKNNLKSFKHSGIIVTVDVDPL